MVRCPLRTFPNHPLTSFLTGLTRSILMFHSRGKAFSINLPFPYLRSLTPLTLQLHLAWTHLRVRKTFPDASTCPGVTSPPPLDALRTFKLASIFLRKEVLQSALACTRSRRGGLFNLSSPTLTQGEEVFFNLFSPTLAQGEEDFLTSSRLRSLKARRTF